MSPATFVVLSGSLTFGAPLILAVRELFVLRRPRSGPGWSGNRPDPLEPRPPKPLPACLVPKPWARREVARSRSHQLEDA